MITEWNFYCTRNYLNDMVLALGFADFPSTSFHHESLKAFNEKLFEVVDGLNWKHFDCKNISIKLNGGFVH